MAIKDFLVVCIDDEAEILEVYVNAIRDAGLTPLSFVNPEEALKEIVANADKIALIISDLQMPQMSGTDLRAKLVENYAHLPFVVVSSYVTRELALQALDLKISGFFDKPFDEPMVVSIIAKHAKDRLELLQETEILTQTFLDEASTIAEELEPVLMSLETDRLNADLMNQFFRGIHTIKGSSGILTSETLTKYAHKYEDLIASLKKGQQSFSDQVYEILLLGFDRIKMLIGAVSQKTIADIQLAEILVELEVKEKASTVSVKPMGVETGQKGKPKESVAVPIEMLEKLSTRSGEITVIRNMVNKLVKSIERESHGNRDVQSLSELLDEMHKINASIQNSITELRKVPLSGLFKPLPRIVRDLAKDLGKQINLQIEGDKLRVDNQLAAVLSNSLVHLVRNSVDHGIESQLVRGRNGKDVTGTISLSCREVGESIEIVIADDGGGIDPKKIAQKALEKSLLTPKQLEEMSERQVLNLIFAPGFSTAAVVTDISGRGVGMDMVKTSVESVGGQILIDSVVGQGSKFTLRLPIPKSVLIITSLLVEACGQIFAVPQDSIRRIINVDASQNSLLTPLVAETKTLQYDGHLFPLIDLAKTLHLSSTTKQDNFEVLLVDSGSGPFGLKVDRVFDAEEIVVKPISPSFNESRVFTGATFMGDGTIGLILNIDGLAQAAELTPTTAAEKKTSQPKTTATKSAAFVTFSLGIPGTYALSMSDVYRLEEISATSVKRSGDDELLIYHSKIIPLYYFDQLLNQNMKSAYSDDALIPVIVMKVEDQPIALRVKSILDIATIDGEHTNERNLILKDQPIALIDWPSLKKKLESLGSNHSLQKSA